MFVVHDNMTIYATRGDVVYFPVEKKVGEAKYLFQPGDIVRIRVCEKKNYSKVFLLKDFEVEESTTSVNIFLDKWAMKFGPIINKPTDYWYEVELNPDTYPDTIIGHNESGPAVFKLFPEAKDVVEGEIPDEKENSAVQRMVVTFVTEYLGSQVETVIKELLETESIKLITQEIIKEENLETIVQEIVREEHVETIVQEIIQTEHLNTVVQEIVKEENVTTIVQEIIKPENTEVIVAQVLEKVLAQLPDTGKQGVTFTPHVDAEGNLSWSNDGGLDNPAVVNLKGRDGKDGLDGKDGNTPVKGEDYYTETEKEELVEEVVEGLTAKPTNLDLSNFENGSFTETVNGEVITHSVTFDSQGRPTKIDDMTINWGNA